MGGRGASSGSGRGASSGKGKGGAGRTNLKSLPELEGTEKQIKWANDIRKNYIDDIDKAKGYFQQSYKKGSFNDIDEPQQVSGIISTLKTTSRRDFMKSESGNKLYEKHSKAKSKEERKKYRTQISREESKYAISTLTKNENKILEKKDASYFIKNRRILNDLTLAGAD